MALETARHRTMLCIAGRTTRPGSWLHPSRRRFAAPQDEELATTFLRPSHHRPRFQTTPVASARLSAAADPNGTAVTCSTAIESPTPPIPPPPLAINAAVAGPPMRGC